MDVFIHSFIIFLKPVPQIRPLANTGHYTVFYLLTYLLTYLRTYILIITS